MFRFEVLYFIGTTLFAISALAIMYYTFTQQGF